MTCEIQQNALTPTLLWYQDPFFVHFTIVVQNVKDETIVINENNFLFKSNTTPNYLIEFDLLNNINKDESTYVVKEKNIKVMLKKIGSDKWSSLTSNRNIYKNNIKIDWDSWYDSDAEEVENLPMSRNDFSNVDFSSMMQQMGGGNMMQRGDSETRDSEMCDSEMCDSEMDGNENGPDMDELMKQMEEMDKNGFNMDEFMKQMGNDEDGSNEEEDFNEDNEDNQEELDDNNDELDENSSEYE
jgi:hypothetical protein